MKRVIIFIVILFCALYKVSAQEKVYPNMPFKLFRLNNGLVMGLELQTAAGPTHISDLKSGRFTGFTLLAGYQINRYFILSAGAGLSYYRQGSVVPLFIDVRYAITLSQLSPYIYADGGLLMNINYFDKTTTFMNPGIGAQYSLSNDLALILSSGIWLQRGDLSLNAFVNFKAGVRYKF